MRMIRHHESYFSETKGSLPFFEFYSSIFADVHRLQLGAYARRKLGLSAMTTRFGMLLRSSARDTPPNEKQIPRQGESSPLRVLRRCGRLCDST